MLVYQKDSTTKFEMFGKNKFWAGNFSLSREVGKVYVKTPDGWMNDFLPCMKYDRKIIMKLSCSSIVIRQNKTTEIFILAQWASKKWKQPKMIDSQFS